MGYRCLFDDDLEPVLLVTNLHEGDTLAVCPEHLADWALSLLTAVSGQEWDVSHASLTDPETGESSDEDDTADGAPESPPGEQEAPAPAPGGPATEDDQGDTWEDLGLASGDGSADYGQPADQPAATG